MGELRGAGKSLQQVWGREKGKLVPGGHLLMASSLPGRTLPAGQSGETKSQAGPTSRGRQISRGKLELQRCESQIEGKDRLKQVVRGESAQENQGSLCRGGASRVGF
jgi:hypothetical protein